MKKKLFNIALILSLFPLLTSCSVIGGIFKTGMGVGIFLVVLVILLIVFVISKFSKK